MLITQQIQNTQPLCERCSRCIMIIFYYCGNRSFYTKFAISGGPTPTSLQNSYIYKVRIHRMFVPVSTGGLGDLTA